MPSPGRNASIQRTGIDSSPGEWRSEYACTDQSCTRPWWVSQRNSSRWLGSFAAAPLLWSPPRSRTSTSMPAAVSWREMSPAASPPPTITTARLSSVFTTARVPSAEIDDGLRGGGTGIRLSAVLDHVERVRRGQAGIADHFPEHLVVVAAVQRVGETRLREERVDELVEPRRERHLRIAHASGRHIRQERTRVGGRQEVEALVVLLRARVARGRDAHVEELPRRERKLQSQLRLSLPPGAAHVAPPTRAECAGELPIDESREAAINPVRREIVRRAHDVHERLDECRLVGAEELVTGERCGRRGIGRLRTGGRDCDTANARDADDTMRQRHRSGYRADLLEEASPLARPLVRHVRPSSRCSTTRTKVAAGEQGIWNLRAEVEHVRPITDVAPTFRV